MTPDQAVTLLVKSESQARELFKPEDVSPMLDVASSLLAEASQLLRAGVAVMVNANKEENPEVKRRLSEFAGQLGALAHLKMATATTNAMVAFTISPITGAAEYEPKDN